MECLVLYVSPIILKGSSKNLLLAGRFRDLPYNLFLFLFVVH